VSETLHRPFRPPEEARVLPFRPRRPAAVRRLKRHWAVRLLGPLFAASAIVGLPVAGAWWLASAPRFALAEVAVEGGRRVSAEWVEARLAPWRGKNLPRLALGQVEDALGEHRWVRGVDLRKELPARLRVTIYEKEAAALLRQEGGLYYLDAGGETIDRFTPGGGEDLLVISRPAPGLGDPLGALGLAEELESERPEWAAGLAEIEILGGRDYRITTEALPFPLLLEAGEWAGRARHLEALLPEISARYGGVAAVDLRFSRRLIVQPARADGAGSGDEKGLVG